MATLKFINIDKIYDNNVQAVFDFNLEIADKEFIVFVGPSGCGKSTTLRMVAGLEDISAGELYIDDVLINDVLPKDRDIAMVFQNYALYPHMTVYDNMAFGLKLRHFKAPKKDHALIQLIKLKDALSHPADVVKALTEECPKKQRLEHVIAALSINQYTAKKLIGLHLKDEQLVEKAKESLEAKIQARLDGYKAKGITLDDDFVILTDGKPTVVRTEFKLYEIDEKVRQASAILGLDEYLDRRPKALSGGQRQRVALGRAIVRQPKVFLMDEPLSNLDAKLRVQTRSEITKIHRQVGATTIYVTHDQTEAMTMADRIVVMKDGRIQQIGTPKEVYQSPANIFVGGFIGTPPMNFLRGEIKDGKFYANGQKEATYVLNKEQKALLADYEGKQIVLGIRPEDCVVADKGFVVKTDVVELLGSELIVYAVYGDQRLVFKTSAKRDIRAEQDITLSCDAERVHFFDPETTERIHA